MEFAASRRSKAKTQRSFRSSVQAGWRIPLISSMFRWFSMGTLTTESQPEKPRRKSRFSMSRRRSSQGTTGINCLSLCMNFNMVEKSANDFPAAQYHFMCWADRSATRRSREYSKHENPVSPHRDDKCRGLFRRLHKRGGCHDTTTVRRTTTVTEPVPPATTTTTTVAPPPPSSTTTVVTPSQ
jgi:hypothetical protein